MAIKCWETRTRRRQRPKQAAQRFTQFEENRLAAKAVANRHRDRDAECYIFAADHVELGRRQNAPFGVAVAAEAEADAESEAAEQTAARFTADARGATRMAIGPVPGLA